MYFSFRLQVVAASLFMIGERMGVLEAKENYVAHGGEKSSTDLL